jgi:hypothetical protein
MTLAVADTAKNKTIADTRHSEVTIVMVLLFLCVISYLSPLENVSNILSSIWAIVTGLTPKPNPS